MGGIAPGMTRAECRRLLYGERLIVWGVHMRETYTPGGHTDGQPGAKRVYQPLPCVDWLADISEAFASLAPNTPLRGVRFSTLTRQRFTPHQRAVWLFYVDGLGDLTPGDREQTKRVGSEDKITRAVRDWRGDGRVGQRLGVGGRRANEIRCEAVHLLAAQLAAKWDRRAA